MKNEIERKTTSLILMMIMVAGGLTFAIPSMEPVHAQSTPNLYVSAVSEKFDNTFGGLQIVQVVVTDPLLTDRGDAMPRVTVDDKDLTMYHGGDGSWYGWFMDKNRDVDGDEDMSSDADFRDAGDYDYEGGDRGLSSLKQLNFPQDRSNPSEKLAIGSENFLYLDLNYGDEIDVVYHKSGNPQTITITYDESKNRSIDLDRDFYTPGAEVYVTITDHVLNIDPTTKDVWQFPTIDSTYNENNLDYTWMKVGEQMARLKLNPSSNYIGLNTQTFGCNDDCGLRIPVDTTEKIITFMKPDYTVAENYHSNAILFTETGPNTGVFELTSDRKDSDGNPGNKIMIKDNAPRNTNTQITYYGESVSVNVRLTTATIDLDIPDGIWNAGEKIDLTIVDADQNKDSDAKDDQTVSNTAAIIPTFMTGTPHTLMAGVNDAGESGAIDVVTYANLARYFNQDYAAASMNPSLRYMVDDSHRGILTVGGTDLPLNKIVIPIGTVGDIRESINGDHPDKGDFTGRDLFHYDFSSLSEVADINAGIVILNGDESVSRYGGLVFTADNPNAGIPTAMEHSGIRDITDWMVGAPTDFQNTQLVLSDSPIPANAGFTSDSQVLLVIQFVDDDITPNTATLDADTSYPIIADFFSYGFYGDGAQAAERVANQIMRIEVEETIDNSSTFTGTLEYIMINQLDAAVDGETRAIGAELGHVYGDIVPIGNEVSFIAFEGLTGSDARINYADIDANNRTTAVSAQQDITTSTGAVSLNSDRYSVGSNVVVTLEDADLNTDPDRPDTYTVIEDHTVVLDGQNIEDIRDSDRDQVGENVDGNHQTLLPGGRSLGMLLEVTIGGERWQSGVCGLDDNGRDDDVNNGLAETGFTLQETGPSTGVFTGSFTIPNMYCMGNDDRSTSGQEIAVTYQDFRDADGQIITVGDSASIGASTGSISLDRTVYPVPFGPHAANVESHFLLHDTAIDDNNPNDANNGLPEGIVTAYIRVNDPDFNQSPSGVDEIDQGDPVTVSIVRSGNTVVLGYAGSDADPGLIFPGNAVAADRHEETVNTDDDPNNNNPITRFGPLVETSPESGIFEIDIEIRYTDGPASRDCDDPRGDDRFIDADNGDNYCILQGDILQVEYRDPADASGSPRTVTDSATFDLRNGALQTDKSVYVIGSDMIVTLIDPDLDLDSQTRETHNLGLIEWDSDAGTATLNDDQFDSAPGQLQETGPNSGIFQVVATIPTELRDRLQRGEEIVLEYIDQGPSGADYVGDNDEEIRRTIFTSNFGATIELDQNVYSWTDKVFITITAPDHNFDSNQVETIGDNDEYPVRVATREDEIERYGLAETGTNTGIFTGEVILTGFRYNADGDDDTGTNGEDVTGRECDNNGCNGPTDGILSTRNDDGLEVSFEFSEDEFVRKSALIRWNIGEIQWLQASYQATSTGVLRVIDADMNLKPESADNFEVRVWSDNSPSGITLTVTETQPASGIFEGTVYFGHDVGSGGHRLSVQEGNTVTARYDDNTLPNPYSRGDSEFITATTIIGTIVPPLERVNIESLRIVDSTNTALSTVSVDQQVQITTDITNTQDRDQPFAYLVQIQDTDGVTVSLSWIAGSLSPNQSQSPSQSWIPTASGEYTITVFAWESLTTPTALSPQQTTTITVN